MKELKRLTRFRYVFDLSDILDVRVVLAFAGEEDERLAKFVRLIVGGLQMHSELHREFVLQQVRLGGPVEDAVQLEQNARLAVRIAELTRSVETDRGLLDLRVQIERTVLAVRRRQSTNATVNAWIEGAISSNSNNWTHEKSGKKTKKSTNLLCRSRA